MFTRHTLVLVGVCTIVSQTLSQNFELEELNPELDTFGSRQLYFNNTISYAIVAAGVVGVAILIAAVALYLYDFYGTTRRSGYGSYNNFVPTTEGNPNPYSTRGRR